MDPAIERFRDDLLTRLEALADPVRAAGLQAYLKSDRDFLGVRVPDLRAAVRAAATDQGLAGHAAVLDAAAGLWADPRFEPRLAAVELLTLRRRSLDVADLDVLEEMFRHAETWALVDGLATKVVGSIVTHDPAGSGPVLDRWAADPDSFWVRRAALLALLDELRAGEGDWDRFCRYADSMLGEREFFIRKAIGWVLRDTSRRRPDLVREWVEPRLGRMSGVTRREATKYL